MRFTEHLSAHITPEWRTRYMDYEKMKQMIRQCYDDMTGPSAQNFSLKQCSNNFFVFCEAELTKVDTFFTEKLSESKRKFNDIKKSLYDIKNKNNKLSSNDIKRFRFDFSEYYLSLILLQNFQKLNYSGFRNILRHHDRILNSHRGGMWLDNVHKTNFFYNKEVNQLIRDVEEMVTNEIEGGDHKKAVHYLRVPSFKVEYKPMTIFRIGFYFGSVTFLLICAILIYFEYHFDINWYIALPLYRSTFFVIITILLWSINMYAYSKYGVNHILIFEIDPRDHTGMHNILELGSFFALIWVLSLLAFMYNRYLPIPKYLPPILVHISMILFLLNPTKTLLYSSRRWFIERIFHLIAVPSFYVRFADFWLGDLIVSLKLLFFDMHFSLCFIIENPELNEKGELTDCSSCKKYGAMVFEMVPVWIRIAQCIRRYRDTGFIFPHIYNFGKFSISIVAIFFLYQSRIFNDDYKRQNKPNTFFIIAILFYILKFIAFLYWDFIVDWGVFQIWEGKKIFLRDDLAYPQPVYYISIIENILFRLELIHIICSHYHLYNDELGKTIMAFVEIIRRFIWNFFRLENEHFNNCGMFRVHRDIAIRPREAKLMGDGTMDEEFIRIDLMDDLIDNVIKEGIITSRISKRGLLSTRETLGKTSRKSVAYLLNDKQQKQWYDDENKQNLEMEDTRRKRAEDLLVLEYDSDEDF